MCLPATAHKNCSGAIQPLKRDTTHTFFGLIADMLLRHYHSTNKHKTSSVDQTTTAESIGGSVFCHKLAAASIFGHLRHTLKFSAYPRLSADNILIMSTHIINVSIPINGSASSSPGTKNMSVCKRHQRINIATSTYTTTT